MHEPLISVVMPIYNVELYLPKAIESVLCQTYQNIELLLIDDGSTDSSGMICDRYAATDKRVHVFHKANGGQAEARNLGLDNANGEWIAFLDADDWIDVNMFETLIDVANATQSSVVACKTQYFYSDDDNQSNSTCNCNDVRVYSITDVLLLLLNNNIIRFEVWNKLWKRDLIGEVRFKSGQIGEEVYFDFEIFKKIDNIAFIDTALHHYLVSREGNTNSRFRIERMCIFDEFESYIQYLNEHDQHIEASVVACIASMFCISVYLEAIEKNQSKDLCKNLRQLFFYFAKSARSARKYKRRAIVLFTISPKLYGYLLKKRISGKNKKSRD